MHEHDPNQSRDHLLWQRFAAVRSAQAGPTCPGPLALATFLDGRLDSTGRAEIEAHLADCRACAATVAEVRWLVDDSAETHPFVPVHVIDRAAALVAPADPTEAPRPAMRVSNWLSALRWPMAAAATIAVCVFGYQAGSNFGATDNAADDRLASEMTFGAFLDDSNESLDLLMLSMVGGPEASR